MKREQARACIEAVEIFPGIRVDRADEALYSAETLYEAGIPIAEITMTVPGTIEVIRQPCGAVARISLWVRERCWSSCWPVA